MTQSTKTACSAWILAALVLPCACAKPGSDERAAPTEAPTETRPAPEVDEEQQAALEALGYFDRSTATNPEERNVTKTEAQAFNGYSLYTSRHLAEAILIDMAGNVVHKWQGKASRPAWMHIEAFPDGAVLALAKSRYLAKLNFASEELWRHKSMAHHDFFVDRREQIHLLTNRVNRYPYDGIQVPVMDDIVKVLTPDGSELRRHALFPVVRPLVPSYRMKQLKRATEAGHTLKKMIQEGAAADLLHSNSIQILKREIPGIAPAGSVLLSMREIDRVVILDAPGKKLLWRWGKGELQGQHHATELENGNILIFDNGIHRQQSRVIEVEPVSRKIVWEYTAEGFYTRLRGAAQKLPNGNVLITESDKGHAFEVTPDKKVVWQFWNPDVVGTDDPTRAVIYRMVRYPIDYFGDKLPESTP